MNSFNPIAGAYFSVFVGTLVLFWIAAQAGSLLLRARGLEDDRRTDFQFIVSACLTLLGLIVAFSFSMALNRYDTRKNYEEQEANAIGTEYVRADLLPARDAVTVRTLLGRYVDERIRFYNAGSDEGLSDAASAAARLQTEMWSAVVAPSKAQPTPVTALAVAGMNDVLNAQGYTQAAYLNRIPLSVWILLLALGLFCNFLVGYGMRLRNSVGMLVLPMVLSISLFLIADIDSPRRGLIRIQPQNLLSLAESLKTQPSSPGSR